MPRLAVCMVCKKIERMIDVADDVPRVPATVVSDVNHESHTFKNVDGSVIMVPEFDPILEDFVARHEHNIDDVGGMQAIQVFPVDQATYDKVDVVSELKTELSKITSEFFEESNFYREEALKCYNNHHNPDPTCPDYLDPAKRIGPKVPPKYQIYLCHMCPIQSIINVDLRHKKGWYDPSKSKDLTIARDKGLGVEKIRRT